MASPSSSSNLMTSIPQTCTFPLSLFRSTEQSRRSPITQQDTTQSAALTAANPVPHLHRDPDTDALTTRPKQPHPHRCPEDQIPRQYAIAICALFCYVGTMILIFDIARDYRRPGEGIDCAKYVKDSVRFEHINHR